MKGDKRSWPLPDGGKLILRELGVPELDALQVQAAARGAGNALKAMRVATQVSLEASLVQLGDLRVSSDLTSEEVYHKLTRRQYSFAVDAWQSMHSVPESEMTEVLATQAPLPQDGPGPRSFRWQLNAADVQAAQSAWDAAIAAAAVVPDDANAAEDQEMCKRALAEVSDDGALILREVLVGEMDRLGEDAYKQYPDDMTSAVSEELKRGIGISLEYWRGQTIKDGLSTYSQFSAQERDIVQTCWERINGVEDGEALMFLGSGEAIQ